MRSFKPEALITEAFQSISRHSNVLKTELCSTTTPQQHIMRNALRAACSAVLDQRHSGHNLQNWTPGRHLVHTQGLPAHSGHNLQNWTPGRHLVHTQGLPAHSYTLHTVPAACLTLTPHTLLLACLLPFKFTHALLNLDPASSWGGPCPPNSCQPSTLSCPSPPPRG
jgi:hypothetical protein